MRSKGLGAWQSSHSDKGLVSRVFRPSVHLGGTICKIPYGPAPILVLEAALGFSTIGSVKTTLQRTEGASLFVVVLVVLLLLSAILAVTAQITLTSRRSVGEQETTLRAQYAADSTVSRAQARMAIINSLFRGGNYTYNSTTMGIRVPQGTNSDTIAGYIKNLCGIAALPLASQTTPICGSTAVGSNVLSGSTDLATRLSLFTATIGGTSLISDAALAAAGGPAAGSSTADKQAFWAAMFGGSNSMNVGTTINGMTTQGGVGAVISSVWRMTGDEYEVHIRVPDINIRATGSIATRSIKTGPQNVEYVLTLGRPPLAKYALFTNHHFADSTAESGCVNNTNACSRITFTSNTRFTGPVHTNEQFNFQGDPTFGGPVTSAGCVAGSIASDNSGCSSVTPGAYFYSGNFQSGTDNPSILLNPDGSADTSPSYRSTSGTSNPQFNASPADSAVKWNANYLQLPPNGNDQSTAATSSGLYINGDVSNMSLSVGNISPSRGGNAVGAVQKMQQISYTTSAGTVNLAINASNQVYAKNANGLWFPATNTNGTWKAATLATATPGTFNGVMYVDGDVNNLNGPARSPTSSTTASSSTVAPAIASFMKLNLTTSGDVGITSDLRYEDPPCDDDGNCNNEAAQNIFGIYASTGDVKIISKYTCNNSSSATCIGTGYSQRTPSVPANVSIQAVLMAGQGQVKVDGAGAGPYGSSNLGSVNLVGGLIENYYGVFGRFGTSNGRSYESGYGRNFVYDTRTAKGVLPPSFPTTLNWVSDFSAAIKFSSGTQVQQSNDDYKTNTGTN